MDVCVECQSDMTTVLTDLALDPASAPGIRVLNVAVSTCASCGHRSWALMQIGPLMDLISWAIWLADLADMPWASPTILAYGARNEGAGQAAVPHGWTVEIGDDGLDCRYDPVLRAVRGG